MRVVINSNYKSASVDHLWLPAVAPGAIVAIRFGAGAHQIEFATRVRLRAARSIRNKQKSAPVGGGRAKTNSSPPNEANFLFLAASGARAARPLRRAAAITWAARTGLAGAVEPIDWFGKYARRAGHCARDRSHCARESHARLIVANLNGRRGLCYYECS